MWGFVCCWCLLRDDTYTMPGWMYDEEHEGVAHFRVGGEVGVGIEEGEFFFGCCGLDWTDFA